MAARLAFLAVALVLMIQISGCAPLLLGTGAAGGVGSVLWVKGKLQENLDVPFDRAHTATIGGLRSLALPIKKDKKDRVTAEIESEFSDGKGVSIKLKSLSESITKITVRVGTFGDEDRSKRILEAIHKNL